MKNIYKIIIAAISSLGLLFIFNLNNDVNVHAFVHSKQEMQKNSEIFEDGDGFVMNISAQANKYALDHLMNEQAKKYIYNIYNKSAEYLTKNYEFYNELGLSYFANDTHNDVTSKFTNYYQYAKYAADLLINATLKNQYKFNFSIKNVNKNPYFSYSKWEEGYINPKWLHYSYSEANDTSTSIPLYTSLTKVKKDINKNIKYYNTKQSLSLINDANRMTESFWIKKNSYNIFMIKMNNKIYYTPKNIFADTIHKMTVFEKYNTYVDKNSIWSNINISNQSNVKQMIFNKNANLKHQNIFNLYDGTVYYQYDDHVWQYKSSYYDKNANSD